MRRRDKIKMGVGEWGEVGEVSGFDEHSPTALWLIESVAEGSW